MSMNLNEILDMLEKDVVATSNMTKEASEKETPAGVEKFTKTASAIKEAEELGAQVAATLLKAAADESEETKAEEKKETKAEEKKETETKTEKEENMDKKASLVDVISSMLEKSALNDTDQNVAASPAVPNLVQSDVQRLVADQDAVVNFTPGTNGANQGGTVNQILDAIVAKAEGQGAVEAEAEGAAPAERQDEDVEKTAAVIELVNNGVDFDSAVNMVKQAAEEIQAEEFEVEKQAAFSALIEAGIDFNDAAILVKEACEDMEKEAGAISAAKRAARYAADEKTIALAAKAAANTGPQIGAARLATRKAAASGQAIYDKAKTGARSAVGAVKDYAGAVKGDAGRLGTQVNMLRSGVVGRTGTLGQIARNKAVQVGAAGTTLAAGGAYAATREKKAAFDALVAEGVDFDTAAQCVAEASQELYGC